ncbi:MAG: phosphoribosyl-AMP cyclohydrolase [Anaerolineae bacterium]
MSDTLGIDELSFNEQGLIPTVVQDAGSGRVLMVAWSNQESLLRSRADGETWFWSRSRQRLWHKGESSGNIQRIRTIQVDCDADTLLMLVDPAGPACHTGAVSCFYRELDTDKGDVL